MTNTQIEQEILKYTKGLSNETLQEVINFIKFLKYKKNQETTENDLSAELSILSSSQTAHLKQEFKDYKNLYPRE